MAASAARRLLPRRADVGSGSAVGREDSGRLCAAEGHSGGPSCAAHAAQRFWQAGRPWRYEAPSFRTRQRGSTCATQTPSRGGAGKSGAGQVRTRGPCARRSLPTGRMASGSSQNRGPEWVPTDRSDGQLKTPYSEDTQNEKNENCEKGEKLFSNYLILIRLQTVLAILKISVWAKMGQNAPLPNRALRAPPSHYSFEGGLVDWRSSPAGFDPAPGMFGTRAVSPAFASASSIRFLASVVPVACANCVSAFA